MSDDLLNFLRNWHDYEGNCNCCNRHKDSPRGPHNVKYCYLATAANEIESLRIGLEQAQRKVHEYRRLYRLAKAKLRRWQKKHGKS